MKRLIPLTIFAVVVILAIYAGQNMASDLAALVGGLGLGLGAAAVTALIIALVREDRDRRDRRAAEEAWRRQPAREIYTDAAWREWQPKAPRPSPQAPAPSPELEAPTRAITTRKQ